jgi:ATP synthase protein I
MSTQPSGEDPFVAEVRKQAERARRGRQMTFWSGLGLIGSVGWMVSLPPVLGALAGRWLDGRYGSGIFWTLTLLLLGLLLGCASAWRHIRRELKE